MAITALIEKSVYGGLQNHYSALRDTLMKYCEMNTSSSSSSLLTVMSKTPESINDTSDISDESNNK